MIDFEKNYEQALYFINEYEFDQARKILQNIHDQHPHLSQINWALGLIATATGQPYDALRYWESVDTYLFPSVIPLQKRISEQLPTYKVVFDLYNKGIYATKENNYEEAIEHFLDAFKAGIHLPLPAHLYKAYLWGLLYVGREVEAYKVFLEMPSYISSSVQLKSFKEHQEVSESQQAAKWKKSLGRLGIILALASVFFISGVILPFNNDRGNHLPLKDINVDQRVTELKKSEASVRQQLDREVSINEQHANKLVEAELKNRELEQLYDLLELTSMDLPVIQNEASYEAYVQGFEAYENKDFTKAYHLLGQSMLLNNERYYSDDAAYYHLQSASRLDEASAELMISFISNESEHYINSPYKDDVLFQLAEFYLSEDDFSEAKLYLEEIIRQYPGEWTAIKSQQLLDTIVVD